MKYYIFNYIFWFCIQSKKKALKNFKFVQFTSLTKLGREFDCSEVVEKLLRLKVIQINF